jgi:hypothetical protein
LTKWFDYTKFHDSRSDGSEVEIGRQK